MNEAASEKADPAPGSSGVTTKEYWDEYWGEGEARFPTYKADAGIFHSYKLLLNDCFEKVRERILETR